jgi:GTP-binding protein
MSETTLPLRNVAIIAHVDHGKTTLVDQIIKQANILRTNEAFRDCMLDSQDLERERGITILSKNISVRYRETKINIIDTPGHADFGGQVERVLKMADGVLLLVDAAEGPMPQTRFVLDKAIERSLKPVVVINKLDKPDARPDEVLNRVFDLFVELDANDDQLDFPVLYASGRDGWADTSADGPRKSIEPLLDAVLEHIPAPRADVGPVQMQVASLDYSDYVGRIGIGRVYRGDLRIGAPLVRMRADGEILPARLRQLVTFEGLGRQDAEVVRCGDLCAVAGVDGIDIGDTIADADAPEALPRIRLDEPTVSMTFRVNDSPLYGKEGRFVSSRHLRERLFRETERDAALKVEELSGESFRVNGRGVMHLSILVETMRREGYELSVGQPQVIYRERHGKREEPIEILNVDVPETSAGKVIEAVGKRRGEMVSMDPHGVRTLLAFHIPTRGMIGLRSQLMTATAGEAIVTHRFLQYEPFRGGRIRRPNGVLISMGHGPAVAFAIDALQQRGEFFIEPGEECYEGMIVGEHCLDSDLVVNLQKSKQLTNVRASGSDRALRIFPPRKMSLEQALEYINDDELFEVTPVHVRLRKKLLTENGRKRDRRAAE